MTKNAAEEEGKTDQLAQSWLHVSLELEYTLLESFQELTHCQPARW